MFLFKKVPQLHLLQCCDLMITHGGMNSIAECIHQEVPMIVYPLSKDWDQPGNAARVVYPTAVACVWSLIRFNQGDTTPWILTEWSKTKYSWKISIIELIHLLEQLTSIADRGFVRRGENLLITGLTRCGKSYLAYALGHQACMLGLTTA